MRYEFCQPETGEVFTADHPQVLVEMVRQHRKVRGLPIGSQFETEVLGPAPADVAPLGAAPARRVGVADVARFLRATASWVADGGGPAPQEEAERRAAICAACPQNVEVEGCWGCGGVRRLLEAAIGRRRTSRDDSLRGCAVCGCQNQAQVHYPAAALIAGGGAELDWPAQCWKGALLRGGA